MDLALEFGMPAEELARRMTEREFRAWTHYVRRRALPAQRNELYQAQIAWSVFAAFGGAPGKAVNDFLIDFDTTAVVDIDEIEDDLEAAKMAFQFNPRPRKD